MRERSKLRRPLRLTAAAVALACLLGGCGKDAAAPKYQASDVNRELVIGNNDFAMRLATSMLTKEDEARNNTLFSPFSVSLALSLMLDGARGETREELLKLLAVQGIGRDAINHGNEVLLDLIEHDDPKTEVRIANAIWAQKGLPLRDDYVKAMKQAYAAKIATLDFGDKPAAAKTVNGWVSDRTEGLIRDLVSEDDISGQTAMMLVNAIYFHGRWTEPFETSATRDEPFHREDGTDVTVPMMGKRETLPHKSTPAYKAVQIPYGSGQWRFIAALPADGRTLKEAEAALLRDPAEWTEGFEASETALALPRFKMAATSNLTETLRALGMVRSLSPAADFSGIAGEEAELFVSRALHKAFIEVDETGTKAAAATAIVGDSGSAGPADVFEFRADRPFLFAVVNATTGVLAFMGRVADPSAMPAD
ncbi:serpin family protein [Paenibacillus sp. MWE-103]|uniref:Serpin family protein n=1 Tax=Paenibacillus artemisiicola TaxID=1172618 RepID=A0ABS3W8D8_9BACL|nr:serpin family protein [Paenibacillus artemisiicola]MBO7744571.1 serpin family protein [Paenibacillus artemisiicola]